MKLSKSDNKKDRTTIPAMLINLTNEMKKEVDSFMSDYGFMFRYAFNRYIEFEKTILDDKELQKEVQKLEKELSAKTGYPIRVVKDAVADAVQLVKARHALMKDYYELWKERYENSMELYEKLKAIPTINLQSLRMKGLRNKMERQFRNLRFYQKHILENTFPPVVFGGKGNFKKLQTGKLTKNEWNDFRNGRVSARGDATKGGNPNLRVVETENGYALQMTSNHKIMKGKRVEYEKILLPLYIATKKCKKTGQLKGRKYPEMMKRVLGNGSAYEVEILRRKGNYYVHIVVKDEKTPIHKNIDGFLGIDTNIDGLGLCQITMKGKPFHFEWLGDDGLQYYPSDKRENKIWEMAHYAVQIALTRNLGVSVEDIEQMHNREMSKPLRRKIYQFCYKKLLKCIEVLCQRYGILFVKVKPQYTSVIGRLKYQTKYRVNVHLSAAFVIARRALNIKEEVPKKFISLLTKKQQEDFATKNEWKQWSLVKTRLTNLLKKKKAKFYQWHDYKKEVFLTLNKPKGRKKKAVSAI